MNMTYVCNTGFNLTAGSKTRTCRLSKTIGTLYWDGTVAHCKSIKILRTEQLIFIPCVVCKVVDCGQPSIPENGESRFLFTIYRSMAVFSCKNGYIILGSSVRMCQANGSWSGQQAQCKIIDCGPLAAPNQGTVSLTNTTYGSIANYKCKAGHNLIGEKSRRCQGNRQWSGSLVICDVREQALIINDIVFVSESAAIVYWIPQQHRNPQETTRRYLLKLSYYNPSQPNIQLYEEHRMQENSTEYALFNLIKGRSYTATIKSESAGEKIIESEPFVFKAELQECSSQQFCLQGHCYLTALNKRTCYCLTANRNYSSCVYDTAFLEVKMHAQEKVQDSSKLYIAVGASVGLIILVILLIIILRFCCCKAERKTSADENELSDRQGTIASLNACSECESAPVTLGVAARVQVNIYATSEVSEEAHEMQEPIYDNLKTSDELKSVGDVIYEDMSGALPM
eukprot:m.264200 g.264200  ORF g.264200 m.264200 type:complete len:455 (+) comp40467_c1_seq13:2332-3696(+)